MPSKKPEDKAKETTISIDLDAFIRTREQVVTGLASVVNHLGEVQNAFKRLAALYMTQTNGVLGDHSPELDAVSSVIDGISTEPLLASLKALGAVPTPAGAGDANDKKERKKRQHDPNAPKRPLTPFFLYMQTARPIIANDLGAEAAKGAVSTEGTRRWSLMAAEDKQLWTNAYKENLRLYNARMHSYKQGHNPNAKDMTDQEALTYAENNNIDANNTADAQLVGEATAGALLDEDAEGEPEKEPTPPPPKATPKSKANRKAKPAAKSTPVVPEAIVPPAPIVPAKEPEKEKPSATKRKRASKKAEEVPVEPEEPAVAETPKSNAKPRKKKAKTDA